MFKPILFGAVLLSCLAALAPAGDGRARRLLTFHSMFPVSGAFTGPDNPVNGLAGDELPWTLESAKGSLDSDGHLQLDLHGLLVATIPSAPVQTQSVEPRLRVVLTCLTEDPDGRGMLAQVKTGEFLSDGRGNCSIDTHLALPKPCVAPALFVVGADDGKWLAVSGLAPD